jgi:hypothetical protein
MLICRHSSNDNAQAAGKKTISPLDVIAALKDAEFEGFVPRLEAELKSESLFRNIGPWSPYLSWYIINGAC